MGRLTEQLDIHRSIGLDTPVFIYHLEANPNYLSLTQEILGGVEQGRWNAVTSVITLMELTVRPWKLGREDVARKYEALLVHFPHLVLVDIDREVARWAARLRAEYGIRPVDALQAASCLVTGVKCLVTNDRRLGRLEEVMEVVVLEGG